MEVLNSQRFTTILILGEGSYGIVYHVYDLQLKREVAIKVEKKRKLSSNLILEYQIFKSLQYSDVTPRVYEYLDHGNGSMIVLEKLAIDVQNFCKIRNLTNDEKVGLLLKMLNCIETIHNNGYIHRDIKPSNFLMKRKHHNSKIVLSDFGLARFYLDREGNHMAERSNCDFFGTLLYASTSSHELRDLSRRDDLWSFLFIVFEFLEGKLPWSQIGQSRENRGTIGSMKKIFLDNPQGDLIPWNSNKYRNIKNIIDHLKNLSFTCKPDYNFIKANLKMLYEDKLKHKNLNKNQKYIEKNLLSKKRLNIYESEKVAVNENTSNQSPITQVKHNEGNTSNEAKVPDLNLLEDNQFISHYYQKLIDETSNILINHDFLENSNSCETPLLNSLNIIRQQILKEVQQFIIQSICNNIDSEYENLLSKRSNQIQHLINLISIQVEIHKRKMFEKSNELN